MHNRVGTIKIIISHMKNLSNIKGLKVLSKDQKQNINGAGPDLCYEYWGGIFVGTVYCCGNTCTDGEYV